MILSSPLSTLWLLKTDLSATFIEYIYLHKADKNLNTQSPASWHNKPWILQNAAHCVELFLKIFFSWIWGRHWSNGDGHWPERRAWVVHQQWRARRPQRRCGPRVRPLICCTWVIVVMRFVSLGPKFRTFDWCASCSRSSTPRRDPTPSSRRGGSFISPTKTKWFVHRIHITVYW